jgi:hypothetical protein
MEKTKTLIAVGLLSLVLASRPAQAETAGEIEWTDSTRLALAQCFVGEAGWGAITEYSAIAHILKRRWQSIQEQPKYADWTFERMVRQYCAVHRVGSPTPRQVWVRRLPWGPLEGDPGFEETVKWHYFATQWDKIRDAVTMFEAGELRDPMPRAAHWGGPMDHGRLKNVKLLPGIVKSLEDGKKIQLQNYFYAPSSSRL